MILTTVIVTEWRLHFLWNCGGSPPPRLGLHGSAWTWRHRRSRAGRRTKLFLGKIFSRYAPAWQQTSRSKPETKNGRPARRRNDERASGANWLYRCRHKEPSAGRILTTGRLDTKEVATNPLLNSQDADQGSLIHSPSYTITWAYLGRACYIATWATADLHEFAFKWRHVCVA